jgi:hypothetical protein
MLLLLWGCQTPALETDLLDRPVSPVVRMGERSVWSERVGDGPSTRLVASEGPQTRVLLERPGWSPDRPALSPDGQWVAFVYAPAGLASLGLLPFEGGEPRQLTNVGLELHKRRPGEPPLGFVPVPADDSLRFEGDRLVWSTGSVALGVTP